VVTRIYFPQGILLYARHRGMLFLTVCNLIKKTCENIQNDGRHGVALQPEFFGHITQILKTSTKTQFDFLWKII
jgi:hypothetical protein